MHWSHSLTKTCLCGRVVNALGPHVQYGVTRSLAGVRVSPGASAYQRIISNNCYAHDQQGVNPGQVRGFALISSVRVSAALT